MSALYVTYNMQRLLSFELSRKYKHLKFEWWKIKEPVGSASEFDICNWSIASQDWFSPDFLTVMLNEDASFDSSSYQKNMEFTLK